MENETKSILNRLANENKPLISQSTLKGSNLLVILADEGGLPVYTRSICVNKLGDIKNRQIPEISPNNEKILLMSGLIEAIMQLKDIVRPILLDLTVKQNKPLYVDYAKAPNGISLVSLANSNEFQQLPSNLLSHYTPLQTNVENPEFSGLDENFEKAIEGPLGEDAAIYWKVLSKIKSDLAEFVSFILVYDENGDYLFSTAKSYDQNDISDPLLESISRYIKQEYLLNKYRDSLSLIGAKRLQNSVIWHFKCYDRIFVFFTYIIPEIYGKFDILKEEMITFISNNLEKFITAAKTHSVSSYTPSEDIKSTRFILLS
ncbi:MAG: hypothetical protein ACFFFH_01105 [Candidatus Thorarchaeota archaeon]